MCFHNSMTADAVSLEKRYKAKFSEKTELQPVYHANGFSYEQHPVLTSAGTLQLLSWGLIPQWCSSETQAFTLRSSTLNARIETLTEKPSFREAAAKRRCIVPSTGFFEWQTQNGKKIPYFISVNNAQVFSMAGIWERWVSPTNESFETFSIVTTHANALMEKIHNTKKRMPVILTPALEKEWLNPTNAVANFAEPFPPSEMNAHTISKLISQPNSNQPAVSARFDYPEFNQLTLF